MVERTLLLMAAIPVILLVIFPVNAEGATAYQNYAEVYNLSICSFEKTVYLTKNIEKTVFLEIKNIGEQELKGVSLKLEGIDKSYYLVTPSSIDSIMPGQIADFEIRLFFDDFVNRTKFNYLVSADKTSKEQPAELIFLEMEDFLLNEFVRLGHDIATIKENAKGTMSGEIGICESIVDEIDLYIKLEEFINARDSIEMADECIRNVNAALVEGVRERFDWIPITLIALLSAAILLAAFVLITKKRSRLKNLIEGELSVKGENSEGKKGLIAYERSGTANEQLVDEKIRELRKRLNSRH